MRHDETVITVAGSPVRAYRAGAGAALVLLHGGGLDDARLSWAPLWPALTGHARLLAPDLPGYGGSPLGQTAPTLEGYRTWLLAFLDAAGIQTAVVVGMSLGGGIALRTALDAPARVAGLVLLAPYGISPRLPGAKSGYFAVHAPRAAAAQAALRHSDWLLRASLRALLHHPGAVSEDLADQVRALLARPGAWAAWSAFQRHEVLWTRPRTHLTGQLAALSCPALLLSGEHDRLVPPDDVRAAAARIRHARFTLVAGAGHWLPRDAPAQVADQLITFLAAAPTVPTALPDGT
jgi:pimeloyl-ACP methyl ester carboxylesterase